MCLVREWWTGLWAKATVLVLSQRMTGEAWETLSSKRRDKIQVTSAATKAMLLHSASVLDLATTVCFLDHQEIKFGPRKMAAPDVDLLSSGSEGQSASQYAWMGKGCLVDIGWNCNPQDIAPLRYLTILLTDSGLPNKSPSTIGEEMRFSSSQIISLNHIPSWQTADFLTKALPRNVYENIRSNLCMIDIYHLDWGGRVEDECKINQFYLYSSLGFYVHNY